MTRKIARTIAIAYTGLLTIFALMSGAGSGMNGMLANVPNATPWVLAWAAVIIAWRYPEVGGWLFLVLAAASVVFFDTFQSLGPLLVVTLPLAVIGGLFLVKPKSPATPEQPQ